MTTQNNPPAFPKTVDGTRPIQDGMSLRDWFAGMASEKDIEAILSENPDNFVFNTCHPDDDEKPIYNRQSARIEHGNRMLAERDKGLK